MTTAIALSKKSINSPDVTREFDKGRLDMIELADVEFGRLTAEPGWKWSESVRPLVQTETCEFPHRMFVAAGTLRIHMDDGEEMEITAGDIAVVAPGHDAWVVGTETCVIYDFGGVTTEYAKPKE